MSALASMWEQESNAAAAVAASKARADETRAAADAKRGAAAAKAGALEDAARARAAAVEAAKADAAAELSKTASAEGLSSVFASALERLKRAFAAAAGGAGGADGAAAAAEAARITAARAAEEAEMARLQTEVATGNADLRGLLGARSSVGLAKRHFALSAEVAGLEKEEAQLAVRFFSPHTPPRFHALTPTLHAPRAHDEKRLRRRPRWTRRLRRALRRSG
jgi:hypothetical protein